LIGKNIEFPTYF